MATRDIPDSSSIRDQYPSNSYKSRDKAQYEVEEPADIPDKKEVRKVTDARVRKQGLVRRIAKSIVEDSIETAKERAIEDIIVPGFKTLIFDTITEMFDVMLFGGGGERPFRGSDRRYGNSRKSDRTSYSDYYQGGSKRGASRGAQESSRYLYEPDDIIVDTRTEARNVLDELDYTIRKYGQASVADFYDIVGVTGDWTDNQYGWTNLRGATIKPVRDGFMIVLPRTQVLKD